MFSCKWYFQFETKSPSKENFYWTKPFRSRQLLLRSNLLFGQLFLIRSTLTTCHKSTCLSLFCFLIGVLRAILARKRQLIYLCIILLQIIIGTCFSSTCANRVICLVTWPNLLGPTCFLFLFSCDDILSSLSL